MRRPYWLCAVLICLLAFSANASKSVWIADVNGAIGPATADYLARGLEGAADAKAALFIIRMDTPGGLDKSMRQIIKAILSSPIPVVSYVHPEGARAASAGTYILYASHIAVMSPATNLGAATPVKISTPVLPSQGKPEQSPQPENNKALSAMEKKVINDAVAYIKGLAQLRQRNVEWAVKAVRDAHSIPAQEALDKKVINIIANDIQDVLTQIDGRIIHIEGKDIRLDLKGAEQVSYLPDWRNKFLSVITDPNVAYILILLGFYGLIFEFSNPGFALPGIIGAICIMLALYAFQVLPISYAGLGLIILGVMLMIGEALAPSFGVLGFGGVIAFVVGSIILMDTNLPAFQIALPIILAVGLSSAGVMVLMLSMVLRSRHQAVVSGLSTMVGRTCRVERIDNSQAMVCLGGEFWQVHCQHPLQLGDIVNVIAAKGVILEVEKQSGDTS